MPQLRLDERVMELTPWDKLPPTLRQARFLRTRGYDLKLLNRGMAAEIIAYLYIRRRRRSRTLLKEAAR
jgi:hypothetical protein